MGCSWPAARLAVSLLVGLPQFAQCSLRASARAPRASTEQRLEAGGQISWLHQPADEQVVINRSTFEERIEGRVFKNWTEFKAAAGSARQSQPKVGGAEHLAAGLGLAVVIILNVLVWCLVGYVIILVGCWSDRAAGWAAFGVLCVYGVVVNACCWYLYQDPAQRLVTNFLFGLVPLAVSSASYMLALLMLDAARTWFSQGDRPKLFERLNPFQQILAGRLIFFLAVIPGFATSVYLSGRVSTGFSDGVTHFDVLSFCLFVDVGRLAGHFFYLIAPEWSIGKDPTSISSRPGLCYVFMAVCWVWYVVLFCLVAGYHVGFLVDDSTKIQTLVCLTSCVFCPLAIYLDHMNCREFLDLFEDLNSFAFIVVHISTIFQHAIFMLMVGVLFDAIVPNLIGIALLVYVVLFAAYKLSGGTLLWFILALFLLTVPLFGLLLWANRLAPAFRAYMLSTAAATSL